MASEWDRLEAEEREKARLAADPLDDGRPTPPLEAYEDNVVAIRDDIDIAPEEPEAVRLLPVIDFANWEGKTPPARQFAWGDWLPLRVTTMLTAPGGTGKSLFEQMLCTCIALGLPFLGMATEQMNTLYVTCEDDEEELWRRQASICEVLGVPIAALSGKLHLVSLCGEACTELAMFDDVGRLTPTDRWAQLVATCVQSDVRLYAFDNATDAMGGDLNDIHQVAAFINLLTGLALQMNGAAMIVHHPNKAGDDWLGSIAWHNKVRSRWTMQRSDVLGDDDGRVLENPKANYGAAGGKIAFRWFKGGFIRDEDLPKDAANDLQEAIRTATDNKLFMACLDERNRQRRAVSESVYGQNYAPRVFEKMPESKRIGKDRLELAMDRLFRIGAIERGYLWVLKGESKSVHGLRESAKPIPDRVPEAPETHSEAAPNSSGNLPETYPNSPETYRKHLRKPSDNLPETPPNTPLGTTYHMGSPAEGGEPHADDDDDWRENPILNPDWKE